MAKITILGCGFGTALAIMWDKYGHNVTAWSNIKRNRRNNERRRA